MTHLSSHATKCAALSIGVALTLGTTAACGSGGQSSKSTTDTANMPTFPAQSTMAKIQSRGELIVGTKTNVPLFGQQNPMTGKMEGLDAEMGRLIGQALFGAPGHVKFVSTPSEVRETSIEQGKVDVVIATYTITPERQKVVSFAGPYYNSRLAILVRKTDNSFGEKLSGWSDLNGHSVCSPTNGTDYLAVQKYAAKAKLIGFDDEDKCVTLVQQKRVEAYATEDGIIDGVMLRNPGDFKMIPNAASPEQPYGIGLKKNDVGFCHWINGELENWIKDGKWQDAYKNTIGTVNSVAPTPPSSGDLKYCSVSGKG